MITSGSLMDITLSDIPVPPHPPHRYNIMCTKGAHLSGLGWHLRHPSGAPIAVRHQIRVQHLGKDLGRVGEARAGAVEVGVAVGEIDAAGAHRGEAGPAGP